MAGRLEFRKCNELLYGVFPGLAGFTDMRHGVFTRCGGCSTGAFSSLNVGFNVGDDAADVKSNRALIADCIGAETLAGAHQVHGCDVVAVERHTAVASGITPETDLPVADALMTNVPGIALLIQVADCQPVMLYDPVRQVIANVHSGWRGSIQNIVGKTVAAMIAGFGCVPSDIMAGIGPSLGSCCAEFIHYREELPRPFWHYKNDADCFDFWAITRDQLKNAGLSEDHIEIGDICTRCRTDLFFSYRKERTTGRFASTIVLTPS